MKVFEVIRESKANGYILTGMLFDNKEDAQKYCDKMNTAVKLDKESDVNYKWYELVLPTPINWITYEVTFFYGLRDPDPVIKIFDGDDQFHMARLLFIRNSGGKTLFLRILYYIAAQSATDGRDTFSAPGINRKNKRKLIV